MSEKKSKDKKLSHNVYFENTQYRLRIYRNDQKFFEKQIHLPKLQYFSINEMILHILCKFADKIAENERKKDEMTEYFTNWVKAMNKAYLLADYIKQNFSKGEENA